MEATVLPAAQAPLLLLLLLLLLLPPALLLVAAVWCLHWRRRRRRTPCPGEQVSQQGLGRAEGRLTPGAAGGPTSGPQEHWLVLPSLPQSEDPGLCAWEAGQLRVQEVSSAATQGTDWRERLEARQEVG